MKKKILIKFLSVFMIIGICLSFVNIEVFADVGDFETYDSDFGSSSFDSDWGSSWDSDWGSSWDSDYDYSYSGSSGGFDFPFFLFFSGGSSGSQIAWWLFIVIFVIVVSYNNKNLQRRMKNKERWYKEYRRNGIYRYMGNSYQTISYASIDGTTHTPASMAVNEMEAERQVKAIDEMFNREEFEAWVKDLFIKLQYAWSDRDWSQIRMFETNELFDQHNSQLQRYIQNKQINVLERVAVNWVKLYKFYQSGDKDVLEVLLNSKMIDYIIDEKTRKILVGDNRTSRIRTYKLTFVRKTGVKSEPGVVRVKAINCPNCGGQLKITLSGKCEYCGSMVVVDDHGWALSELEPFK